MESETNAELTEVISLTNPYTRNETVRKIQSLLTDLGYNPGSIDGVFGPKTETAVIAFQTAKGLSVDGKVGPQTWAALNNSDDVDNPDDSDTDEPDDRPSGESKFDSLLQRGGPWSWIWQYLDSPVTTSADLHVLDGFDHSASNFRTIIDKGSFPIAYFSCSYEAWRPDGNKWTSSDKGKKMDGWDERWPAPMQ